MAQRWNTCNEGDIRDSKLSPRLGRSPGQRNGNSPGILGRESHGQRITVGYSPHRVAKSRRLS